MYVTRKLKVTVSKSKVMRIYENSKENATNVSIDGKRMEEVKTCKNLWVIVFSDGRMKENSHRIGDGRMTVGPLMTLWKRRHVSREAKANMYGGIVQPTLLYGSEVWVLNIHEC